MLIGFTLRNNEPTLVIWLAYSEELCQQAVIEFQKAWDCIGDRTISTYRFWGNHDLDLEKAEDDLIVAGLAKVYNNAAQKSIGFISKKLCVPPRYLCVPLRLKSSKNDYTRKDNLP